MLKKFGFLRRSFRKKKNAPLKEDAFARETVKLQKQAEEAQGILADGKEASRYEGLYEGIYQAAVGRNPENRDAYEEWCDRAKRGTNPEGFINKYGGLIDADEETYQMAMQQLCREFWSAGIRRDMSKKVCVNAKTKKYYIVMGDIADGEPADVFKAAWKQENRCLEQGFLSLGGKEE